MSDKAQQKRDARIRRHRRVRKQVRGTAARPRMAVYRSNRHINAQIIDDISGRTIAAASSVETGVAASGTSKASFLLSVRRLRVSTRWCSIAVDSSTTVVSLLLPMPPEKLDWSSDGPQR